MIFFTQIHIRSGCEGVFGLAGMLPASKSQPCRQTRCILSELHSSFGKYTHSTNCSSQGSQESFEIKFSYMAMHLVHIVTLQIIIQSVHVKASLLPCKDYLKALATYLNSIIQWPLAISDCFKSNKACICLVSLISDIFRSRFFP